LKPWERAIEEQIREAIEQGAFDDLPGKGLPLDIDGNPFEDRLAGTMRRILRNYGASHPIIEARRALEQEIETYRVELRRSWQSYRRFRSEPAWQHATSTFRERIKQVNRQIKLNNLKAPLPNFHLRVVDAEAEIAAVQLG
jgi:DnaJ family protein C protein 28